MKMLIAEDDLTTRRLLEGLLGKWGWDIVSVTDGDQAWEALQGPDAPRMAILDWVMPGLSGVEVCRRLRQREDGRPTYVILLTVMDARTDIVDGFEAGADDYVIKPFNTAELRARIEVGRRMVELQSALARRVTELQQALDRVKTLQGLIPVCVHCHKVRDDKQAWLELARYIEEHSEASVTHGLCPECLERHYPEDAAG